MTRKQSRIPDTIPPKKFDDFRLIKGIGSALSGRLQREGIRTYNELASMSPSQLAEKIGGLSTKQITKQDWIGQARKLAPPKTRSKPIRKETAKQTIRQHYENFTIEFLLDEKKVMHRTRVMHVQSGDADTWAGWEAEQLISFLVRHTGAHIPVKKPESPETSTIPTRSLKDSEEMAGVMEVKRLDILPPVSNICEATQPSAETIKPISYSPVNTSLTGMLRLKDFKVLPTGCDTQNGALRQSMPYHVRLTLDLTDASIPDNTLFKYKATITFKQLGGASYLVAEESKTIILSECATLDLPCTSLPPGLYRPEAFVRLSPNEGTRELMASLKGELIQFF